MFRRYWIAHAISTTGSTVSLVVLPILMYQRTGSPLLTALLGSVYIAPYILFGLVAGAIADRADRRAVMVTCELGGAVALGSIPIASALGVLTTGQLFVCTATAGVLFVGFDAAQFGAVPLLFGSQRLVSAMTALGSVDNVLYVAGTAVGGVLATAVGAAPAIAIDAVSFLVSALLLTTVRGSFGERVASAPGRFGQIRADVAEGVRYLWGHRLIRALTFAGSVAALTGGAVQGLLVVFAVRRLGLADDDARIGLLFSAGGLGALAATVCLPWLSRTFDIPRTNLVARTASLGLVIALALCDRIWTALIVYLAFAGAEAVAIWSAIAFRQLNTPDRLQGRVNVVARMTALAGQPVGAAIGGAVAQVTDVRVALVIMSSGLFVSVVIGWLGPLRTAPRPAVPTIGESGR